MKQQQKTTPEYIRPVDSRTVMGVSKSTLYRWKNEGRIKFHKVGSMSFVRTQDLRDVIEGSESALGDKLGDS